jgi:hypothetical protein
MRNDASICNYFAAETAGFIAFLAIIFAAGVAIF